MKIGDLVVLSAKGAKLKAQLEVLRGVLVSCGGLSGQRVL